MTEFRQIVNIDNKHVQKSSSIYKWAKVLKSGKYTCVPAQVFSANLLQDFNCILEKGVILELTVPEYQSVVEDYDVRWFGRVVEVAGYRVLVEWIGSESSDTKVWVNALCGSVYSLNNLGRTDPKRERGNYIPPQVIMNRIDQADFENFVRDKFSTMVTSKSFNEEYDVAKKSLFKSKFEVGKRLELLDYLQSKDIYPAVVKTVMGRRVRVTISKEDAVMDYSEDHCQMNKNLEFWTDQDSFFLFPVGWATRNGYNLKANAKYTKHTKAIAQDIEDGKKPKYAPQDITPDVINNPPFEKTFEVGQKFEFLDPLSEKFQDLKVASVLRVLKDGYICVGMDGPDQEEESVPLHSTSSYLFPVGYANQYDIPLKGPEGFSEFAWAPYFKQTRGVAAPDDLFKEVPENTRMRNLKKGYKLEASDMANHSLICPSTVVEVKGRLVVVSFDGWGSEYDQMFDVDSHDLFPLGWCEVHGYPLQAPQGEEEEKKRKRK